MSYTYKEFLKAITDKNFKPRRYEVLKMTEKELRK